LIEQETSKENIEYRIMNVECRRQNPSKFCGSIFWLEEVSYKQKEDKRRTAQGARKKDQQATCDS